MMTILQPLAAGALGLFAAWIAAPLRVGLDCESITACTMGVTDTGTVCAYTLTPAQWAHGGCYCDIKDTCWEDQKKYICGGLTLVSASVTASTSAEVDSNGCVTGAGQSAAGNLLVVAGCGDSMSSVVDRWNNTNCAAPRACTITVTTYCSSSICHLAECN